MQWVHPRRIGRYYSTALAAKKARSVTLTLMTLPLLLLRLYAAAQYIFQASRGPSLSELWYGTPRVADEGLEELQSAAKKNFGSLAKARWTNPAVWDIVLSAIVLGLWMAMTEANPRTMLQCTLMPWLKEENDVAVEPLAHTPKKRKNIGWFNTMKQFASVKSLTRFARPDEGPTTGTAEAFIRKRGRQTKHRKSESSNESGYMLRSKSKSKSKSPGMGRKSVSPYKPSTTRGRSQSRAKSQGRQRGSSRMLPDITGITANGRESAGIGWFLSAICGLSVAWIAGFGAEAADSF